MTPATVEDYLSRARTTLGVRDDRASSRAVSPGEDVSGINVRA